MNRALQTLVLKELCPDGIWQLNSVMKSVLKRQISQLPKKKVLDIEIRCPQNPALMRAFLVKFFTRHYFQVQNSLLEYMTCQDFLDITQLWFRKRIRRLIETIGSQLVHHLHVKKI